MKGKELDQSRNKLRGLLWMVMAVCLTLTGCAASFGPMLLNKEVIQYDNTVLQSEEQLLLLNILRMHDGKPIHFTAASGVQATFLLSHTGTLNPSVSRTHGDASTLSVSALSLGKTVTDNPTITIGPIAGKDFAQRLLKPIESDFVNTIILQRGGRMIDRMLRVIGGFFVMVGPKNAKNAFEGWTPEGSEKYTYPNYSPEYLEKEGFTKEEARCLLIEGDNCVAANSPPRLPSKEDTQYYQLFRKVVLHIRAMAMTGHLQVFRLCFDTPSIEGTLRSAEDIKKMDIKDIVDALEKQYGWKKTTKPATQKEGFILTQKSTGDVKESFMAADALKGKDMKDILGALGEQYQWKNVSDPGKEEERFNLTKRYLITALTDFDFSKIKDNTTKMLLLQTIQRDLELNELIKFEEGMIIVLFRGDQNDKGNRWPIYGYFNLRNFRQVLEFLAESLTYQPGYRREYDVAPSRFTKELLCTAQMHRGSLDNPELTLTITSEKTSGTTPPRNRVVDVDYNEDTFWISPPPDQTGANVQSTEKEENPCDALDQPRWDNLYPLRWDKEVFSMLYDIFEFNRIQPAVSPPSTVISK